MSDNEGFISNKFLDDAHSAAVYMPKLLEQQILVGGRSFLSIFTVPAFLVLRRDFGTQAIHPITYCLGWLALQLLSVWSFMVEQPGLVDVWTLYLGFIALTVAHALRLRPLILNMDLEADGEYEGQPWWPYNLLPFARQPVIRCIYEPMTLVIVPFVLMQVGILTAMAAIYLSCVGFCLMLRTLLHYYEVWTYIRDLRNAKYRAMVMQAMVGEKTSGLQTTVLPVKGGPAELLAVVRATATLDPEFAKLKSDKLQPV